MNVEICLLLCPILITRPLLASLDVFLLRRPSLPIDQKAVLNAKLAWPWHSATITFSVAVTRGEAKPQKPYVGAGTRR